MTIIFMIISECNPIMGVRGSRDGRVHGKDGAGVGAESPAVGVWAAAPRPAQEAPVQPHFMVASCEL